MQYYIGVLRLIAINMIEATGFILLAGWTGIFSLGHAGFIAIGAYASSLLIIKLHLAWPVAVALGGVMAGIISLVIGKPALKLKSGYFAIASMGFGEAVRLLIENMEIIGGPRGLIGIPRKFSSLTNISIVLIIGVIVVINIRNSRFGRSFFAVRDDALAAEAMGINTAKTKQTALFISAIYCGIGGALYASYMTYIQPTMFSTDVSSSLSTWIVFGGLGSLTGGLFATFLLTALTETFRAFALYRMFFYGLALVLIIALRPQGLFGTWEFSPSWVISTWNKIIGKLKKETPTKSKRGE